MKTNEIKNVSKKEFGELSKHFRIFELDVEEARASNEDYVWHPEDHVIKVGCHFTNARKRAFQHATDNTAGTMRDWAADPETKVLLFNLVNPKLIHWVTALEVFFGDRLNPRIQFRRMG